MSNNNPAKSVMPMLVGAIAGAILGGLCVFVVYPTFTPRDKAISDYLFGVMELANNFFFAAFTLLGISVGGSLGTGCGALLMARRARLSDPPGSDDSSDAGSSQDGR